MHEMLSQTTKPRPEVVKCRLILNVLNTAGLSVCCYQSGGSEHKKGFIRNARTSYI